MKIQLTHHGVPAAAALSPPVSAAVEMVRAYIADNAIPVDGRLPAEAELAVRLGITRGRLRQALGPMEQAGEIWRGVGQGTFVGNGIAPAMTERTAALADETDQLDIFERTNPVEVLEARLMIEPKLAALAAVRGTPREFWQLDDLLRREAQASDPREAQAAGSQLHRVISTAAHNALLGWLFDQVFEIRERTSWGLIRPAQLTSAERATNLDEHRQIVEAITSRDPRRSETLMNDHLESLRETIMGSTKS